MSDTRTGSRLQAPSSVGSRCWGVRTPGAVSAYERTGLYSILWENISCSSMCLMVHVAHARSSTVCVRVSETKRHGSIAMKGNTVDSPGPPGSRGVQDWRACALRAQPGCPTLQGATSYRKAQLPLLTAAQLH
jgi:hypothetical protein